MAHVAERIDKSSRLCHHGIKGQEWGKRNGPPYPLTPAARSPKEKQAAKGKKQTADSGRVGTPLEADVGKQKTSSIKKGIRSLQKRIREHESKLSDPAKHYPEWSSFRDSHKASLIQHWEEEIENFKKSITTRIDELKRRGEYDE